MNLNNVQLVVSDMDGTLLNSKGEISPLFFELFKKLQQKNITFCAASGRQYNSIVNKLAPIKDDIYIIAENGAIAKKGEELLLISPLDPQKIIEIIPILRTIPNANIVLCSDADAFIETNNSKFINLFQQYYHSYTIVDDLMTIAKTTPILKIAVHHFDSSHEFIYPSIKHLADNYLIKVSGQNWLDISEDKANKGSALKEVQRILNVTKATTMAFGDYHNDIEMLQEADFSFAMKNAHPDITELANYSTESHNDFGVERVLEKLINS